jgi:GT2 family glycosyltransferase
VGVRQSSARYGGDLPVSRPEISVVMPFAGDEAAARHAVAALRSLLARPGDELILADNSGVLGPDTDGVEVVPAPAERSPAHARNSGAARAGRDWILFLDSDCEPRADLLDAYFAEPVAGDVGALAGEVRSAPGETLVGRYGAARGFLSQQAHLDHPFRPRAAAANLLVRRAAFEAVGGFYEGVRAAEDTDFTWRLQQAGWRLELRSEAFVWHRYRTSLGDLRRQWRGYAAGRAWLARRYEGFEPEPGIARAARRTRRPGRRSRHRGTPGQSGASRVDRGAFVALDALLSVEELTGFALSNRPRDRDARGDGVHEVVLVADRFPARGDPLVELAQTLERVRVEAFRRPEAVDLGPGRGIDVDYLEDDGALARASASMVLVVRHPFRSARDVLHRDAREPRLRELAPAVRRLERDRHARVRALGSGRSESIARRIAGLAGREFD